MFVIRLLKKAICIENHLLFRRIKRCWVVPVDKNSNNLHSFYKNDILDTKLIFAQNLRTN